MKLSLASLAYFAVAVVAGQPSNVFFINTPSFLAECEPATITWNGGQAPYFLCCDTFASVVPGADPTGTPIESLGEQTGDALTWVVNIAAGTPIGFILRDSLGDLAQSAPVIVDPGTSTACLAA